VGVCPHALFAVEPRPPLGAHGFRIDDAFSFAASAMAGTSTTTPRSSDDAGHRISCMAADFGRDRGDSLAESLSGADSPAGDF
jgi:hypothetical protein